MFPLKRKVLEKIEILTPMEGDIIMKGVYPLVFNIRGVALVDLGGGVVKLLLLVRIYLREVLVVAAPLTLTLTLTRRAVDEYTHQVDFN